MKKMKQKYDKYIKKFQINQKIALLILIFEMLRV